jgi:hypothetical protein
VGWAPQAEEKPVMKVGLFINTQFPEGSNLAERVPEMVAQVRAARDAGFASLWFPHHWLTYPMQMLQITPVMGYVAAHAKGMTIGPNILILPPLNPMHVAEEAATLDVLTGGITSSASAWVTDNRSSTPLALASASGRRGSTKASP